jgi:hypothetical protein
MNDRQAIVDVTIAYTWALDTKNVQGLREVFAADATANLRGVECDGVDSIIDRIGGAVSRFDATQHMFSNHQVVVNGDEATCRCQLQSQHVKHGVDGGDTLMIGGYYDDRLARTADGWRITRRVLVQTWTTGNPAVIARSSGG